MSSDDRRLSFCLVVKQPGDAVKSVASKIVGRKFDRVHLFGVSAILFLSFTLTSVRADDRYIIIQEISQCSQLVAGYAGEAPLLGTAVFDPLKVIRRSGDRVATVLTANPNVVSLWRIEPARAEFSSVSSTQTGKHVTDVTFEDAVTFLEIHPTENLFVAGNEDSLRFGFMPSRGWKFLTVDLKLPENSGKILKVNFSPDGSSLAVWTEISLLVFQIRENRVVGARAAPGRAIPDLSNFMVAAPVAVPLPLPLSGGDGLVLSWSASSSHVMLSTSTAAYRLSFRGRREPVLQDLLKLNPSTRALAVNNGITITSATLSETGGAFVLGLSNGVAIKGFANLETPWRVFDLFAIDSPLISKTDRARLVSVSMSNLGTVQFGTGNGNNYIVLVPKSPEREIKLLHRNRTQPVILEGHVVGGNRFLR
jgi:WD40 repeat protein